MCGPFFGRIIVGRESTAQLQLFLFTRVFFFLFLVFLSWLFTYSYARAAHLWLRVIAAPFPLGLDVSRKRAREEDVSVFAFPSHSSLQEQKSVRYALSSAPKQRVTLTLFEGRVFAPAYSILFCKVACTVAAAFQLLCLGTNGLCSGF